MAKIAQPIWIKLDSLTKVFIDSDDDVSSVDSVFFSNCKHLAKNVEAINRCSRCHITHYCSVLCKR